MVRHLLAEREEQLPLSTIGKLISVAERGGDVISLGAGELDVTSSTAIRKAAQKALSSGETHYSPPEGLPDLREALVKKLKKVNNISLGPENILVTNGATEGIFLSLLTSIDPGEGVLLPDPGFLAFKPTVEVLNGIPLSFPLHEKDGFCYSVDEMKKAIIPEKTKVLIINSPANPTGQVLQRKDLEEISDFAIEHDLTIISDEAYETFVYGEKHISMASLNGMKKRTVTLHSFSKSYAMPGFRIGYASGPEKIIKAMTKLHVFTTICASTVSQFAALEALRGKPLQIREYDTRRRLIYKRVREMGFFCIEPKGAFYLFPNIKKCGLSSLSFSELLLKKARVAVVPGTEFGRMGEGFVRMSYATPLKRIERAMDRLDVFVKKLT